MKCKNCSTPLTGRFQKKFCSTSCAATYNNRVKPKRVAQIWLCAVCGSRTTDRRRFCDRCLPKKVITEADLTVDSRTDAMTIKKFLLRTGIFEYACHVCSISDWNGKQLSLELHHINGRKRDNRIENLQLLCPNCHSQTETFRGRNKRSFTGR